MTVTPDRIDFRTMFRRWSFARPEVRRVATVRYRVLPFVRRTAVKVTFNSAAAPMFFRPWRIRRLERALADAGWKVSVGDPI
jgi:hypothetical protein